MERPNTEVWPSRSSAASEMEAVFLRQSQAHLWAEEPMEELMPVSGLFRTALSWCWKLLLRQCPRQRSLGGPAFLVAGQVHTLALAG